MSEIIIPLVPHHVHKFTFQVFHNVTPEEWLENLQQQDRYGYIADSGLLERYIDILKLFYNFNQVINILPDNCINKDYLCSSCTIIRRRNRCDYPNLWSTRDGQARRKLKLIDGPITVRELYERMLRFYRYR